MISLRDLMTGAVPGNVLNQIGLGDASDPQFNRFTYNISGSLGPNPQVNTGMPTVFAGPYTGFGGGPATQPMQQRGGGKSGPMIGYGGTNQSMTIPNLTRPSYLGNSYFGNNQPSFNPFSGFAMPGMMGGGGGKPQPLNFTGASDQSMTIPNLTRPSWLGNSYMGGNPMMNWKF